MSTKQKKTRVTSCRKVWEDTYDWLKEDGVEGYAYCNFCKTKFKIDNSGIGQVKAHASTTGHVHKEKLLSGKTKQRVFVTSKDKGVSLSSSTLRLSPEEQVTRAEIIQALDCVESNYSFSSMSNDNKKFRLMFPGNDIANAYEQGETKTKCMIQFGIAPHFRKEMLNDFKNKPFTFKFDETTTSQIKKQYDGYVQYWSTKMEKVINRYCGSLFLGHCAAKDLLNHFFDFGKEMNWDTSLLLHLGMDGPNVNLKFEQDLLAHFEMTTGHKLLNIDTCTLHKAHTSFKRGISS